MKRALILAACAVLISSVGCNTLKKNADCAACGPGGQAANGVYANWQQKHDQGHFGPQPGAPSAPQMSYPYYTTRGPRDFLSCDYPPLGG